MSAKYSKILNNMPVKTFRAFASATYFRLWNKTNMEIYNHHLPNMGYNGS